MPGALVNRVSLAAASFTLRTASAVVAPLVLTLASACGNPVATTAPVHETEDVAMDAGAVAGDVSDVATDAVADVVADVAVASDVFKSKCPPCPKDHWCDIGIKACVPKPDAPAACLCAPACTGAMQCLPGGPNGRKCQPMTCTGKPPTSGTFWRVTSMKLASPQVGCDLDGDGKVNNALATSLLGTTGVFGYNLLTDWTAPRLTWAFAGQGPGTTTVATMVTALVPGSAAYAACLNASQCNYQVLPDSFVAGLDGACRARTSWLNCNVDEGATWCSQAAPGFDFPFWPCPDENIFAMQGVVFQANAPGAKSPILSGMVCGSINKAKLPNLAKTDIDADGDGIKESASAAFVWEAAEVKVIGLSW